MRCDMCRQEEITEVYEIEKVIIDLCPECFEVLQAEVFNLENPTLIIYVQIFKKLGIEPKR